MRIGLDTRNTGRPGGTGVATYAQTLARACEATGLAPRWVHDAPATRLVKSRRFARSLLPARTLTPVPDGHAGHDLYRTAEVRDRTFRRTTQIHGAQPPTVMHWTYPLPLRWQGVPNVVTIHDLIPVLHPDFSATPAGRLHRRLQDWCDQADAIVTVSRAVQQDIIATFRVDPAKIHMLSQPVDLPDNALHAARQAASPAEPGGFLYFGTIERRKNIGRLIDAHGRARTTRPLTLIGGQSHGGAEELAALSRHPAPRRVRILPWCDRPALLRAIMDARAVVFPSLAEGFGLPIIEAMALGTPVLTSCGHATQEIAGTAALLVNSTDTQDLAHALTRLDTDETLCADLRDKGRTRAGAFAFGPYAHNLNQFYHHLLAN